jgi:endonuclease III
MLPPRAKFLVDTCTRLQSLGGEAFLVRLRSKQLEEVASVRVIASFTSDPARRAPHAPAPCLLFTQRTRICVVQELIQFAGVGRKVADCVALFALAQPAAIPVDTHVWQARSPQRTGTLEGIRRNPRWQGSKEPSLPMRFRADCVTRL